MEKENFIHRLMQKMGKCDKDVHESVDRLVNELLDAFRDELSSSTQDRSSDADPILLALKRYSTYFNAYPLKTVFFSYSSHCERKAVA